MGLRACLFISLLLLLLLPLNRVGEVTGCSGDSTDFNKSSTDCSDCYACCNGCPDSTTCSTTATESSAPPSPKERQMNWAAIWSSLGVLLMCCVLVLGILCHRKRRRPRDSQTKPEPFYEVIKDTGARASQRLEKTDSYYCLAQTPLPAGNELTQTDTAVEYSTVNKSQAAQNITQPNSDVEYATINKPRAAQREEFQKVDKCSGAFFTV
ncbi:uncharacterized protein [Lepisosteus oculatus]|uniref:uncharacterized protein isoform X2 n=1 Tax=Lepisosteus oculatus TaxID=7918 RepID=UPI0035F52D2B